MKLISAIACSAATIGTYLTLPATAEANPDTGTANSQTLQVSAPVRASSVDEPQTSEAPATPGAPAETGPAPHAAMSTPVHCVSAEGGEMIVIDGANGCRATTYANGNARSLAFDGIGYAMAADGANAYGIGLAGGLGASEGVGGTPIAIGAGPDAVALTSLISQDGQASTAFAVSVALGGSRAQVLSADGPVICLGVAAFAWNSETGESCVATPLGNWQSTTTPITDQDRV